MNATEMLFFIVGLVLLIGGADLLVRSASQLAAAAGVSPLVIGLTVVAFGTSAPELAISVQASWTGSAELAVGNVVGSNICNILLILGLAALAAPLVVARQLVRWEVPVMIGVSVLLWALCLDQRISRLDGLFLFIGVVVYVTFTIWQSRREQARMRGQASERARIQAERNDGAGAEEELASPPPQSGRQIAIQLLTMAAGLMLLVFGARWMVDGAIVIARYFGLSELIIGLTVVAVGTSLPEIATSILASLRGERDIAVGNAVGSNLFNILAVLGAAGMVAPEGIPVPTAALALDIPVMTTVAVACLPIFFTGYRIDRWEGALFLAYYVAYTAYLILQAREHASLPLFSTVMLWFVIPLTAVTLLVLSLHRTERSS